MLSVRTLLFASLIPFVISSPAPPPIPQAVPSADTSYDTFQELLNAIPEESIHAALHKHLDTKYQDGVWEHDRSAIEAVHSVDPSTATRLLVGAALDLIKRQNPANTTTQATTQATTTQGTTTQGTTTQATSRTSSVTSVITTSVVTTRTSGGTTSVQTVATTSTQVVPAPAPPATTRTTSSTPPAVVVPVQVSTTNSAGSVVVTTSSAVVSQASVSVAVVVTSTNSVGSTVRATSIVPAAVVTSNGRVTTSPVSIFVALTGRVMTTTDAQGSTFLTTLTPVGGEVSSLVLLTTTLANGEQAVVTSFADVGLMTDAGASPSASESTKPRLQNGAESVRSRGIGAEAIALVGGAIGVAIFL
ncbi:hypothetical protein EJ08DRAFT_646972 [Tothia fuscella]|uniref:Uncharacterized protein n=1 Tax=Tothia fuscella TaxID=1048955 RepID=A0A9P4NYS5_9PEZI|nr:hypothetical protein EJ08DRAFT_646972 [Tothia fuscella]